MWEKPLREQVATCAAETGCWTLVGTLDAAKVGEEWEHYNSAILFAPSGLAVQRYHKRRMVPFGELTPYRDQIPILAKADFGQSEFTPGREPGLFPIPDIGEVSCLICFESTFSALARKDVAAGAQFLVNITNDFWFGPGAGPLQHERFANLRACETRTPLVRCGNTGISCVIDPYGRVHGATGLFETVLRSFDVLPGDGSGFYVRWGDWILYVWGGLALFFLGASLLGLRRRQPR
jgi:apolipoprotein N-acyltransferase